MKEGEKDSLVRRDTQKETVFGPGTIFRGVLRFRENLRIKGKFDGTIDATGSLFVDAGAELLTNQISVSSLFVSGTVNGTINVVDTVEMLKGSVVTGDVSAKRLRIADGVVFDGQVTMIGVDQDVQIFSRPTEEIKRSLLEEKRA